MANSVWVVEIEKYEATDKTREAPVSVEVAHTQPTRDLAIQRFVFDHYMMVGKVDESIAYESGDRHSWVYRMNGKLYISRVVEHAAED